MMGRASHQDAGLYIGQASGSDGVDHLFLKSAHLVQYIHLHPGQKSRSMRATPLRYTMYSGLHGAIRSPSAECPLFLKFLICA